MYLTTRLRPGLFDFVPQVLSTFDPHVPSNVPIVQSTFPERALRKVRPNPMRLCRQLAQKERRDKEHKPLDVYVEDISGGGRATLQNFEAG